MTLPTVLIATTPERQSRLDLCLSALSRSTVPFVLSLYWNRDGGCVVATRRAVENLRGEIFLLNDDMVVEPDCLEKLQTTFRSHHNPRGLVLQPQDNYHPAGEIATAPYLDHSTLWPALSRGYRHYFWDAELATLARRRGSYLHVPAAKLDHQHVTKGFADDSTYRLSAPNWDHDRSVYLQREAAGFPEVLVTPSVPPPGRP